MARVSPSSWAGIERHQKPAMTVIDGDAVCSPHALVKASSCLPPVRFRERAPEESKGETSRCHAPLALLP